MNFSANHTLGKPTTRTTDQIVEKNPMEIRKIAKKSKTQKNDQCVDIKFPGGNSETDKSKHRQMAKCRKECNGRLAKSEIENPPNSEN